MLNAGILGELFKVPALLQHLAQHQTSNVEQLVNFFEDHYGGAHTNDGDHASFPFQNSGYTHCVVALPFESKLISPNTFLEIQDFGLTRNAAILDLYESKGIWQPPGQNFLFI